ncbi:MAG: hypothetical protein LBF04_00435 [Prevotellaceae bacterium]|jgi:hypothetical protein|nr:hypothetical protein [Prevotellaceae bacterium]
MDRKDNFMFRLDSTIIALADCYKDNQFHADELVWVFMIFVFTMFIYSICMVIANIAKNCIIKREILKILLKEKGIDEIKIEESF